MRDGEIPGASMTARGVIDYANRKGDVVMTTKAANSTGQLHAMFIGNDTYLGAEIGGEMRWEKESGDEELTAPDRFLPGPGGTSPDRMFAVLKVTSTKLDRVGEENVRGVQATHYKAHLKAQPGVDPPTEPAVVDAWIDEEGLARRIRVPMGDEDVAGAIVEFYDFGVQADIEAPAADEVVTQEELEKLMSKECGKKKAGEGPSSWCFFFGTSEGSGSTGYGPTETMPRRVTDGK